MELTAQILSSFCSSARDAPAAPCTLRQSLSRNASATTAPARKATLQPSLMSSRLASSPTRGKSTWNGHLSLEWRTLHTFTSSPKAGSRLRRRRRRRRHRRRRGAAAADADVAEDGLDQGLGLPPGLGGVVELGDDGGEEGERLGGGAGGGGEGGEEVEEAAEVAGVVVEGERGEEPDGLQRRVRVGVEHPGEEGAEVGEVRVGRGGDGGEEAGGGVAEEGLEAGEAAGGAHGGEVHHDGAGGHGGRGRRRRVDSEAGGEEGAETLTLGFEGSRVRGEGEGVWLGNGEGVRNGRGAWGVFEDGRGRGGGDTGGWVPHVIRRWTVAFGSA